MYEYLALNSCINIKDSYEYSSLWSMPLFTNSQDFPVTGLMLRFFEMHEILSTILSGIIRSAGENRRSNWS